MKRFPILVDHPGESFAFRRQLQQAVALCLVYRAIGTIAATVGFVSARDRLTEHAELIIILAAFYAVYSVLLAFRFGSLRLSVRNRPFSIGERAGAWLDYRAFFVTDLLLATVLNVVLAVLLRQGVVFEQYTDVFAVALITSVVLWTGRRGGKAGLVVFALTVGIELLKAPVNGAPFHDVKWDVIGTRAFWALSGWVVAIGVVRILIAYADREERLQIEDRLLDRMTMSHDHYKDALRLIETRGMSEGSATTELVQLAHDALASPHQPVAADNSVAYAVDIAVRRGQAAASNPLEFCVVNATLQPHTLADPAPLTTALTNLCTNAARHSRGTKVTVRWCVNDDVLVVSVRDNGLGTRGAPPGEGLALASKVLQSAGGELVQVRVTTGSKWLVRLPTVRTGGGAS